MADVSTKPYFLRAIYEWCSDCGFTPYLSVRVDDRTRVPMEYVKNGEIVLNVSLNATRNLTINNELIQFSARFNGVSEGSRPVFSYSEVNVFVAILLASTSGWLNGLMPITAPAMAVPISQRTNSSARSCVVSTWMRMMGLPAFSSARTAASWAASGASSRRR